MICEQNVSAGTLSLASPPLLSCVEQTGGSASAFLEEQEVVMSSGMKEIEEKLKLLLTVQTKLEESVTPPSRQKQESSGKDDFYVNCGAAIRNLREELPALFYKDLNYDIYRYTFITCFDLIYTNIFSFIVKFVPSPRVCVRHVFYFAFPFRKLRRLFCTEANSS